VPTALILATLVVSLLVATPAAATPGAQPVSPSQRPSASVPAPATTAAPAEFQPAHATVPVPEIAQRAEEVARLIRDLEASLLPGPIVVTIEKRLPEIAERLVTLTEKTKEQLGTPDAAAALDESTDQWRTSRAVLMGYVETLAQRARSIEEGLERLTVVRDTWTRARADARDSRAPGAVIERIDGVLKAVAEFRVQMETQRASTLLLQDRVAREVALCEGMLARIAAVRVSVTGRLFEQDGAPIWNIAELGRGVAELPERVGHAALGAAAELAQFVSDQRRRIEFQMVLFAGMAALMFAVPRRVPDSGPVFSRPVSAALLLTTLTTVWIYVPTVPHAAGAVFAVLALASALRLMQLLGMPRVAPRLDLLGVLFAADLMRHFATLVPLLAQQMFVFEMAAALAVLWWHLRSSPENSPNALRALMGVFGLALAAGLAGYVTLGMLVGASVIGGGYLALVLGAGVGVANGLVSVVLRVGPLSRIGLIARKGPLVERRAHAVLRLLAVVAWVAFALRYLGLGPATADFAQTALAAELRRGSVSISLGDVLVFIVTVGAAYVLSGLTRFVLEEDVYPRFTSGRAAPSVLSTLLHYAILVAGFFLALAALGVDLTKVTILAGAFGVGIGFGLQNIVNNFVSGLVLLVERRIAVGDAVQIGDVFGQVKQMGMRACTVRTWEGAEVIVPNASLVAERVANWTLSDHFRRVDVPVGVAYGTPPEKVIDLLLEVARTNKRVLLEPAPIALFLGFADSALSFELRAWTYFELMPNTKSELGVAIYEALQAARIEIPFPQREVRVRS